jgi:hypothetical protein
MLTFVRTAKGDYKAETRTGTYTIRKRPDGYFDLYKNRVRLNETRGRLKDLKAEAEVLAVPLTGSDSPSDPMRGDENCPDPTRPGESRSSTGPSSVSGGCETEFTAVPTVNSEYSVPVGFPGSFDADQAARDQKRLDMLGRAAVLAEQEARQKYGKAPPMPGAERRTSAEDEEDYAQYSADFFETESRPGGFLDPLAKPEAGQRTPAGRIRVEADGRVLFASRYPRNVGVQMDRETVPAVYPEVAFARVPRGTARTLRKALRAAGRPDLAAVPRLPPDPRIHGKAANT